MAMAERHPVNLDEALLTELHKEAATQNKSVDEVVREALTAHVRDRAWVEMVDEARERTERLGIQEEDVNDIIAQFRRDAPSVANSGCCGSPLTPTSM